MPFHKLTPDWCKIASTGEDADVLNTGMATIEFATGQHAVSGTPLAPGGRLYKAELRTDLFARCLEPRGEITVTNRVARLPDL